MSEGSNVLGTVKKYAAIAAMVAVPALSCGCSLLLSAHDRRDYDSPDATPDAMTDADLDSMVDAEFDSDLPDTFPDADEIAPDGDTDYMPDSDADGDSDSDTDADADSDTDEDADSDADFDLDADLDSELDADLDSDIEDADIPVTCMGNIPFTDCTIDDFTYDPTTGHLNHADGARTHYQEPGSMFDYRIAPGQHVIIQNGAVDVLLRYEGVISGDPATSDYTTRFTDECTGGVHDSYFEGPGVRMGVIFVGGVQQNVYSEGTGNVALDMDGNRYVDGTVFDISTYFSCFP